MYVISYHYSFSELFYAIYNNSIRGIILMVNEFNSRPPSPSLADNWWAYSHAYSNSRNRRQLEEQGIADQGSSNAQNRGTGQRDKKALSQQSLGGYVRRSLVGYNLM